MKCKYCGTTPTRFHKLWQQACQGCGTTFVKWMGKGKYTISELDRLRYNWSKKKWELT